MKQKRFWAFASCIYQAAGGLSDFVCSFDTEEEVREWLTEHDSNDKINTSVLDTETHEVITFCGWAIPKYQLERNPIGDPQ